MLDVTKLTDGIAGNVKTANIMLVVMFSQDTSGRQKRTARMRMSFRCYD